MADQDPVVTLKQSELNALVQEAVEQTLRAMGITKDKNGANEKSSSSDDSIEVVAPRDGSGSKKGPKEEEKGAEQESVQAQLDELRKLLKKQSKENEDAAFIDISLVPKIHLPPKFKMPELVRFDGTGDPKAHVRHYVGVMRISGLDEDEITQLFPLSLSGAPLTWYYTLKDVEMREWGVMVEKFVEQYSYNTELETTRRELEETIQGERETFSAFVKRWRIKASKMLNRPNDEELNGILLNCLNSCYYNSMYMIPVDEPFTKFYKRARQIEDRLKLAASSSNEQG